MTPTKKRKVVKMKTERMKKHQHPMGVHEGHGLLYSATQLEQALRSRCCGGIIEFTFCPLCGFPIEALTIIPVASPLHPKKAKRT